MTGSHLLLFFFLFFLQAVFDFLTESGLQEDAARLGKRFKRALKDCSSPLVRGAARALNRLFHTPFHIPLSHPFHTNLIATNLRPPMHGRLQSTSPLCHRPNHL